VAVSAPSWLSKSVKVRILFGGEAPPAPKECDRDFASGPPPSGQFSTHRPSINCRLICHSGRNLTHHFARKLADVISGYQYTRTSLRRVRTQFGLVVAERSRPIPSFPCTPVQIEPSARLNMFLFSIFC
jgi:hypothetical protein